MKLSKLDQASTIAIKSCMGAKEGEKILVITDDNKKEIGYSLYQNALRLGFESFFAEMKPMRVNGQEPPLYVADLMKKFDVVFCPTTTSLTHTDARREASQMGARVATFPGITKEVMIRGMNADYKKISDLTVRLKGILEGGKTIHVTSELGTDISFSIDGRKAFASKGLFHQKGESGNLPTGEAFLAPVEGSADGVFVVDGSMAGLGVIKGKPLHFEVSNGLVTKISGNPLASKLQNMLLEAGAGAHNIAEFGIGTNDKAKISGVLLEDEKVLGTIHIALGNNVSMGGNVNVKIHLDGVIKKPTVWLDDQLLMKKGKLLVQ